MTYQPIGLGTVVGDKTGDPLRTGGIKIDANFAEIYKVLSADGVTMGSALNLAGNIFFQTEGPLANWSILWADNLSHFTQVMGAADGAHSGVLNVYSRAFGSFYDVSLDTPNLSGPTETTRLGITGGVDWALADFNNCTVRIISTSGSPLKLTGGNQALLQVECDLTSATDASGEAIAIYIPSLYTATDGINTFDVHYTGFHVNLIYGVHGGAAPIGSTALFFGTILVNNSGSSQNEHTHIFGNISAAFGSTFRCWGSDMTILGPTTGVQMNLVGGDTWIINNYYNGAMATNGPAGCFNAVTRTGQGSGAAVGEWAGKTTYPVDYGFYVGGWSGTAAAKTIGFTVGIQVGGAGGMWNAPKHPDGSADADAVSILGVGIDIRDVTTFGVYLHDPHVASAIAIGIGASTQTWTGGIDIQEVTNWGIQIHNPNVATATAIWLSAAGASTWAIGLDMSAATCTSYAIKTGTGPVLFGDVVQTIVGLESTGGGNALLGGNCPAVTVGAPYKWIKMKTSDGSAVYYPVWK